MSGGISIISLLSLTGEQTTSLAVRGILCQHLRIFVGGEDLTKEKREVEI